MKNYYEILNISQNAKPSEIKNKYLELVKKYHPETTEGEEAHNKFVAITEAYSILINPFRKKKYDRLLSTANENSNTLTKKRFVWDNQVSKKIKKYEKKTIKREGNLLATIEMFFKLFEFFFDILDVISIIIGD